ncbi:30S ribosomal protein S4 [candidate division WWE3 bacterium]|nr:30S ribosomal protein S4 [candidate division WWE3 bacterium]
MSRYTGPVVKKQKRYGLLPTVTTPTYIPGAKRPRRKSEYGVRLDEKQKLKFMYGLQEKQFRRLFAQAKRNPKNTGQVLLQLLESRLDNVVYRLGLASTIRAARQLVTHGNIIVDGKRLDIPSYNVKAGQTVALVDSLVSNPLVVESLSSARAQELPSWLERKGHIGVVKSVPSEDDLQVNVDLQLIIEYYSR